MKFELQKTKAPSGMPAGDKRRLAMMIGVLAVVSGILLTTLRQARRAGDRLPPQPVVDESAAMDGAGEGATLLAVPELDVGRVSALVNERESADQVVLDSEAADLVMASARRYTPRHYAELGHELDGEKIAALEADPAAARGKPFTARGRIVALRARTGAAHEEQFLGRLELEDGSAVHFLTLAVPEGAADVGGFVRVDGLFLKLYRSEDPLEPGTWISGPLLVGAAAVRSYPSLGQVTQLDRSVFDELEDADLAPEPGQAPRLVPETPLEPLWELMAFARDLPPDAIAWDKAPVLDQRLLDQLLEEPASFRALPVRIPISRLQDGRVKLAGENPARMERAMQGWIGNTTWRSVIQFRTPVLRPELVIGDLVYGRGFFLHDFSYESSERGLRVAPVFVLQALERHVPEPSLVLLRIPWVMAGIGLVLCVLFVVLTRRDKLQSAQFYQELARRRRQRGKGNVGTAAP